MKIAIVNASTLMDDPAAVGMIMQAIQAQCDDDVAPLWNQYAIVTTAPSLEMVPADTIPVGIVDDPDQANALGYHYEDVNGRPIGRVFVRPILENGGDFYSSPTLSVSATVSHEVLEILGDKTVSVWWQMPNGSLTAAELCDAVEGDSYTKTVLGKPVQVSNFIKPNWMDVYYKPNHITAPYDFLDKLNAPFTMSPGGYMIILEPDGTVSQIYGKKMPEWKRELKAKGHRVHAFNRRVKK